MKANQGKNKPRSKTRKSTTGVAGNKRKKSTNKRTTPKKRSVKQESPQKKTAKRGPKQDAAKKGPKKKSEKTRSSKGKSPNTTQRIKDQESKEKSMAVNESVVGQTNDKLLPWEDILPPKTKS